MLYTFCCILYVTLYYSEIVCCSDRILTFRIISISHLLRWELVVKSSNYQPVVSWGAVGNTSPPSTEGAVVISFLNHLTVYTSLEVVACCSGLPCVFHRWMCLVFLQGRTTLDLLNPFSASPVFGQVQKFFFF